jgi:peptidoglycan hydrolase CwlO-like protein
MKRVIRSVSAVMLFGGALLLGSCSSDDTNGDRIDRLENRLDESADNMEEWAEFKREAKAEIEANDRKIEELREKRAGDGKVLDDVREERIEQLERENDRLEDQIDAGKPRNENWEAFKREFRHDMNELGESIKDIGKDNKD